jgi:hypothetical protein
VLFNWTWYVGMLRDLDGHELVALLEYQGKGAIQVDGHSADMRVVEKLTRKGNEILYEVTVEAPNVFAEPKVMAPMTLRLGTAPDVGLLPERAYCQVYERGNISSQIRH